MASSVLLPDPSLENLKIKFHESILVTPSQETEKRSFFLSSIDQVFRFPIPIASFFNSHPDYPPEIVAKRLKTALSKLLVEYDFMAGRLKMNNNSNRVEIDCNGLGVGFVVASSECSLLELGDVVRPNLGFYQLVPRRVDTLGPEDDQPLFLCQVTSFECGGFVIGMSINHILFDGVGIRVFMENLASQAFENKPLAIIPCHDRSLLDARSPPQISFPNEFLKPTPSSLGFDLKIEELSHRVFKFTPSIINGLKEKAKGNNKNSNKIMYSSYTLATAVIWQCKVLSCAQDEETVSTLLTPVEIRSKLNPPLPQSYCGNAVVAASTSAKCGAIVRGDFFDLAEMMALGHAKMSDEYIRSAIDWLGVHKGLPSTDFIVSSWMRLGFNKVVYPWGKPVHSGPVISPVYLVSWVFPDEDDFINAMVSLPVHEMERFESHFRLITRSTSSIHYRHNRIGFSRSLL